MPSLRESTWEALLTRAESGRITPFLGAGTCCGTLPLGSDLANRWAAEYDYTFGNSDRLMEVAQYLAVRIDAHWPKELVFNAFVKAQSPDFEHPEEPHGLLAELPCPVYLTTNYDDFMFRALLKNHLRDPVRDYCRWHEGLLGDEVDTDDFQPHAARPLVYHFHGMLDLTDGRQDMKHISSLVLTEDDYIHFLASDRELIPQVVLDALRSTTCLFVGYGLGDWNLRVILHRLRSRLGKKNIAVFPLKSGSDQERDAARKYFDRYYGSVMDIEVYWGTAEEFCAEFRTRQTKRLKGVTDAR